MHVRRRVPFVLAAAALLVAGCTGDDDRASAPHQDPSRSPAAVSTQSPETTPEPAPPPRKDACYDLGPNQLTAAHDASTPVKCRKDHTTQTYAVARLSKQTVGDPAAIDTEKIAHVADRRCGRILRKHLGADRETLALSRFSSAWFVPEEQEFARGARWLRCDVVANKSGGRLAALPRRTADLLDSGDALDEWGTCAKASAHRLAQGKGQRLCARNHNWRAVSTARLGKKSDGWPGAKVVRKHVLDRCEDAVRSFTGNETGTAGVGWLPPTRQQWESGHRFGTCWAKTR